MHVLILVNTFATFLTEFHDPPRRVLLTRLFKTAHDEVSTLA
jgi:hypothetical protein